MTLDDGELKFEYEGRKFKMYVPFTSSTRIDTYVYCEHHDCYTIRLGSVWSKRKGLGNALYRKVRKGLKTKKRCNECKKQQGVMLCAGKALKPLLDASNEN